MAGVAEFLPMKGKWKWHYNFICSQGKVSALFFSFPVSWEMETVEHQSQAPVLKWPSRSTANSDLLVSWTIMAKIDTFLPCLSHYILGSFCCSNLAWNITYISAAYKSQALLASHCTDSRSKHKFTGDNGNQNDENDDFCWNKFCCLNTKLNQNRRGLRRKTK